MSGLATTKLHPLPLPRGALERPELLGRIAQKDCRLTVIVAPAGWGKSTLLAQWCAAREQERVACVGLDALDDEPLRFWAALVESLRATGADITTRIPASPRAAVPELWHVVVPDLVNDLARAREPVVLTIDDYQHIADGDIHVGMGYLIEHLPPGAQVVLAARADPPLGLAGLRARGLMEEIRTADLALDVTHTAAHVREVAGAELAPEDCAVLQGRTEGWPAGVHLAALSLRGRDDPSAFVARFAGDHRHVADYLTTEVFSRIPEAMASFLRRCSVLDELDVDLCAAITEDPSAATRLARAEADGLFVTALDDQRRHYRMHPLVASWLRHRLMVEEPEQARDLHGRAARWYLEAGLVVRAGDQAVAAGDAELVCDVVARHGGRLMETGQVRALAKWLAGLPEECILHDPVIALAAASTAATAGDLARAERLASAAEDVLAQEPANGATIDPGVELAVTRATISLMRRDLLAAERLGHQAAAQERDPLRERYGIGHVTWATVLLWLDRCAQARDAIEEVWPSIETPFVRTLAAGVLAVACLESGDATQAERVARAAMDDVQARGAGPSPEMVLGHIALGAALTERAEWDEADRQLRLGIELSEAWSAAPQTAYGRLRWARLQLLQGRVAEAVAAIGDVAPIVASARAKGLLAGTLARTERALRTARGHTSDPLTDDLTPRETDILHVLPSTLSQREIGARLGVSLDTVKTHTRNIYDKLGVSSRAEAVERARELDLL